MHNVPMLGVIIKHILLSKCAFAERHLTKWPNDQKPYAECPYAEGHYAECGHKMLRAMAINTLS